mmetsp:Transcript_95335/g.199422  ORF Transcript_95335/g.199422 Transcript_95335/m.199422 type:complete len:659 (-) Transcript_95335:115-2091(-)
MASLSGRSRRKGSSLHELPVPSLLMALQDFVHEVLQPLRDQVLAILREVESEDAAVDELKRTEDYLTEFGRLCCFLEAEDRPGRRRFRCPPMATMMPLNQPLYSLFYAGILPGLSCQYVYLRAPAVLASVVTRLWRLLRLTEWFANATLCTHSQQEFTQDIIPMCKVVQFTGNTKNSHKLETIAKKNGCLFVSNGSGLNPVVVAADANLVKAANEIVHACCINGGQDCSRPDQVLVESSIFDEFLLLLEGCLGSFATGFLVAKRGLEDLSSLIKKLGHFESKNGGIARPRWHGDLETRLQTPTVAGTDLQQEPSLQALRHLHIKPLLISGARNFEEIFAPVVVVDSFASESELQSYFEHSSYRKHAMYVTLFGSNSYVQEQLPRAKPPTSVLMDQTAVEWERGVQAFGGFSADTSYLSFEGVRVVKPIQLVRDLWLHFHKDYDQRMGVLRTSQKHDIKLHCVQEQVAAEAQDFANHLLGLLPNHIQLIVLLGSVTDGTFGTNGDGVADVMVIVDSDNFGEVRAEAEDVLNRSTFLGQLGARLAVARMKDLQATLATPEQLLEEDTSLSLQSAHWLDALMEGRPLVKLYDPSEVMGRLRAQVADASQKLRHHLKVSDIGQECGAAVDVCPLGWLLALTQRRHPVQRYSQPTPRGAELAA